MNWTDIPLWLQVIAAIASATAAIFAARATIVGPISAAQLAEKLRREADKDASVHSLKMHVFTELMRERGTLGSEKSMRALNLVDVAFRDSRLVRDATSGLYTALRSRDSGLRNDKTIALINAMAADLDLHHTLTPADIDRVFQSSAPPQ